MRASYELRFYPGFEKDSGASAPLFGYSILVLVVWTDRYCAQSALVFSKFR
jgi:hypothetical protein